MNRVLKILFPLVSLIFILRCSTQKDTFINRNFHSLTTKYNVLYNGKLAFNEAIKQLNDNYTDNYWEILPIEPLKIEEIAFPGMKASTDKSSEIFAKAEEKAVKAIQKHSMNIYNKERNPQIDDAYLLLGKSRYYSQRFVPALEAFNYVIKNYPNANLIDETKVWQAKTNLRLQNEEVAILTLKKLLTKKELTNQIRFDAQTALAMAYTQTDSLQKVINHLKKSVDIDIKSEQKTRNLIILGQLYRSEKKMDSSNLAFQKVISDKKSLFKYRINANIEYAKNLEDKDHFQPMILRFESLIKDRDNRPYLDKLYYHLALIYLKNNQPEKAEDQLKKSVKAKNGDRNQKALTYEKLGDIQFNKGKYLDAGNYYDSVLNFTTDQNSKRFLRTSRIRKNLEEVILNENLAQKNDSILKLVTMNDDEKLIAIDKLINQLKLNQKNNSNNSVLNNKESKENNKGAKWYFYNTDAVKLGSIEFQKKWGNRILADNWRTERTANSSGNLKEVEKIIDQKLTPEYYLAQIPTEKTAIDSITKIRNEAYYKLGLIYKEQFQRADLAIEKFKKVLSFGVEETYYLPAKYHLFRIYNELGDSKALVLKEEIIKEYPNSIFATLVQNSEKLVGISDENTPEKEYKKIYLLYEDAQYDEVLKQLPIAIKKYSQTVLIPKFELLKAYTISKTEGISSFKTALEFVATTYPNTEEGEKAKELINTINKN